MSGQDRTIIGIDIGGTSVKAALVVGGRAERVGRSRAFAGPSVEELRAAVSEALSGLGAADAPECGLCLPGVYDDATGTITASANIPALVGVRVRDLVPEGGRGTDPARSVAVPGAKSPVVLSDALAAAVDYWSVHRAEMHGRLLALSLGTGVGAAVLDEGQPLRVNGMSPGHLGQMDVTLSEDDPATPIGPDGGRGSLEGYIGLPALRARYGDRLEAGLAGMTWDDPPLRALARAVRVAHALYRPQHVVLLGGVGLRLAGAMGLLKERVADGLTRLARPGWTLNVGDHDLHAAIGAARWVERGNGT